MEFTNWLNTTFSASEMALITTILGWFASAFVQALPDPDNDSGKSYRFIYKFTHLMAANLKLVAKQNREDKEEGMTILNREN